MARKMTEEQKAKAAEKRASNKAAKGAEAQGPVVSVKTRRDVKSRWRAGRVFGPEPVEIPLDDLGEGQLEALEADPSLVVQLEG